MTDSGAKAGKRDWVGQTLKGRYLVESVLGAGGMGTAYLAHDRDMDRKVVVKIPNTRFLDDENFRSRFTKEVRALTRLPHPHVVKVLDAGEAKDDSRESDPPTPFAVLEYMEGGSLKDRLEKNPQSPQEVLGWLDDIAKALDFVHSQAVVHRDVKPGNILFDLQGNAVLADFGIVKALGAMGTGLTRTGATPGSPPYMGPEVGLGTPVGAPYDQYALGVLVYEALSGAFPHEGTSGEVLIARKAYEDPIDLAKRAPQVPAAARAAVMRAISRDPKHRYSSCAEFARSLADALPGRGRPADAGRQTTDSRTTPAPRPPSGSISIQPIIDIVVSEPMSSTDHLIEILEIREGHGPSRNPAAGQNAPSAPPRGPSVRPPGPERKVDFVIREEDLVGSSSIDVVRQVEPGLRIFSGPPTSSPDLWASTRMGPTGRMRNPALVLLLHLVTGGLYHLLWVYSLFREARAYADRRRDVRIPEAGPAMAVYVLTPLLIAGLVGAAIYVLQGAGQLTNGSALGLGIASAVVALPFAIAGWMRTAGLVTKMRIAAGVRAQTAGNTTSDAWWMLFPGVGFAIYCWLVQSRTNRYWHMEAAAR